MSNPPSTALELAAAPLAALRLAASPRRVLSRVEAAHYVGISPNTFDKLVAAGQLPQPFSLNRRRLWDIKKLDYAVDALSDVEESNPLDRELGL